MGDCIRNTLVPVLQAPLWEKFIRSTAAGHSIVGKAVLNSQLEEVFSEKGVFLGQQRRSELPEGTIDSAISWIVRGLLSKHRSGQLLANEDFVVRRFPMAVFEELGEQMQAKNYRFSGGGNIKPILEYVFMHNDEESEGVWLLLFFGTVPFIAVYGEKLDHKLQETWH